MLLDPPGWNRLWPHGVPHWPYASALDQALTDRGIPPGIVRADVALRPHYEKDRRDTIYMILTWDVSRTGARGGARLSWDDETGWSYAQLGTDTHEVLFEATVDPLRRVFAAPGDVAGIAEGLVRNWRTPEGEYGAEWERASEVRKSIEAFHQLRGS
ncbi:hypothetical protein [Streptomyces tibetensis]|uniref:hypothetical protein n=1 Tax=Streptomyces tibetensis TaxID=2382123 RepID=UPI0033D21209